VRTSRLGAGSSWGTTALVGPRTNLRAADFGESRAQRRGVMAAISFDANWPSSDKLVALVLARGVSSTLVEFSANPSSGSVTHPHWPCTSERNQLRADSEQGECGARSLAGRGGPPRSAGAKAVAMMEEARADGCDRLELRLRAFALERRLSAREADILLLLLRGMHPKAIGSALGCQYSSVRTHLGRMCRKLECSGSRELVLKFYAGVTV
jgi:DNA-binding CsgD family transcriptional regulator